MFRVGILLRLMCLLPLSLWTYFPFLFAAFSKPPLLLSLLPWLLRFWFQTCWAWPQCEVSLPFTLFYHHTGPLFLCVLHCQTSWKSRWQLGSDFSPSLHFPCHIYSQRSAVLDLLSGDPGSLGWALRTAEEHHGLRHFHSSIVLTAQGHVPRISTLVLQVPALGKLKAAKWKNCLF